MKIFVPNLAFEDELAGNPASLSRSAEQVVCDFGPLMKLLGCDDDMVISADQPLPAAVGDEPCTVVPWGWTESTRSIGISAGMQPSDIPSLEAVRIANSRVFSSSFDRIHTTGPLTEPFEKSFGRPCDSLDAWHTAAKRLAEFGYDDWITKPEHSHAGRNRLQGGGPELTDRQGKWLRNHFAAGRSVWLEPRVRISQEWGLQFSVDPPDHNRPDDRIRLDGVTGLLNDRSGQYVGSIIGLTCENDKFLKPAIEHGLQVCRAAAELGYFGPVGIDCFAFRTAGGDDAVRLCSDVNARCTMGRLALQLMPQLSGGEVGVWYRLSAQRFAAICDSDGKTPAQLYLRNVRAVVVGPEKPPAATTGTVMVLFAEKSAERLPELTAMLSEAAKQ